MSEAASLFGMYIHHHLPSINMTNVIADKQNAQGNAPSDSSKQDVVGKAAQMALKMYMKQSMGGGGGSSGGSSGGVGGLLNMASKFLK